MDTLSSKTLSGCWGILHGAGKAATTWSSPGFPPRESGSSLLRPVDVSAELLPQHRASQARAPGQRDTRAKGQAPHHSQRQARTCAPCRGRPQKSNSSELAPGAAQKSKDRAPPMKAITGGCLVLEPQAASPPPCPCPAAGCHRHAGGLWRACR